MRIAFFTENSYQGGLDTYIITLINNWPNSTDDFVLICNKSHPGIDRFESEINRKIDFIWHDHYHINYFSNFIIKHFKSILLMKIVRRLIGLFNFFFFLYYLIFLKKTLFKFDPDSLIVVNGGYPGGLSCLAASVCWGLFKREKYSIHNFHNIALSTTKYQFLSNYIDYLVEKHSSSLVSVSDVASKSILSRISFKKTKKLSYIYNGIESKDEMITKNVKNELLISSETKVCLILGTYEARKGHSFLFKVFEKVLTEYKSVHLIACGFGTKEEKDYVRSLIRDQKLKKNVHILDFRLDINNLFAATDILLIGSQEYESFGLTAVEAMLYKIPVVSTNVGGLKEVVKNDEGGYVFDKNDEINFSKKVIELLKNESLRVDQGIKGSKRVERFFLAKKMSQKYYDKINYDKK